MNDTLVSKDFVLRLIDISKDIFITNVFYSNSGKSAGDVLLKYNNPSINEYNISVNDLRYIDKQFMIHEVNSISDDKFLFHEVLIRKLLKDKITYSERYVFVEFLIDDNNFLTFQYTETLNGFHILKKENIEYGDAPEDTGYHIGYDYGSDYLHNLKFVSVDSFMSGDYPEEWKRFVIDNISSAKKPYNT